MTRLILEAATEVGEMALFSLDHLPSVEDGENGLNTLERENRLFRLTSKRGDCSLLQIYLEEEPPFEVLEICATKTKNTDSHYFEPIIDKVFVAESGSIAFGGIESAFCDFLNNNDELREETSIPPGRYKVCVYPLDLDDTALEEREHQFEEYAKKILISEFGEEIFLKIEKAKDRRAKGCMGTIILIVLFFIIIPLAKALSFSLLKFISLFAIIFIGYLFTLRFQKDELPEEALILERKFELEEDFFFSMVVTMYRIPDEKPEA